MKNENLTEPENKSTVTEQTTEKKREILSIQVSTEEKRQITKMAVKDCGISVSEFVRTKIFMEPKNQIDQNAINIDTPVLDEERQAYEDTIDARNKEIQKLKTEIVNIKVSNVNVGKQEAAKEVETNPNVLTIQLEPEFKLCFEKIKTFRETKLSKIEDEEEKASFMPIDKYLKTILLRGFKRSFNNGQLGSATGITTDDIKLMAEKAGIDYYEEV